MHRTVKGFMRALALTLLLVIMTGTISAYADLNYTGYVNLRLMDGDPAVGADTRYKLTTRKSGTVMAVFTNNTTGAQTVILNKSYDSAKQILLTVPGHLITDGNNYTLDVTLNRGNTIGHAVHTFSTVQPVSRVDSLSVTSSFSPINGETFRATFALPSPGKITAVVKNASGMQVAVIAQNAPYINCAHALTWDGITSEGLLAPAGHYTFEISCFNGAGTSPVVSAPFQITGDTSGMLIGRAQGTIQSLMLPGQPKDGDVPAFTIRASRAGNYTLKITDKTTGRSYKFTGKLQAGMNTIAPNFACVGGHSYTFQMVQQVSRKNAGKAELSYTAYMDPPSISISAPNKIQAGYGAALPIQYTTGTKGDAILYVTDTSHSVVLWSVHLLNQSKGTHTYYWDGRGNDGKFLPTGTYVLASDSRNSVGSAYGNAINLQYEGAIEGAAPFRQGAISIFGAEDDPESVERTPIDLRYQASAVGMLKITVRNIADGKTLVAYNQKTAAGAQTITISGDYFAAGTYEIEATLTVGRKTAGRAKAYVKTYAVAPEITNLQYTDNISESKWGEAYTVSFNASSTGFVFARVQNAATGEFVSHMLEAQYTPAGYIACTWDGTNDNGELVPNGNYRFYVFYDDCYGNRSNIEVKDFTFNGIQYPEGVLDYAIVGAGTHKTPINIHVTPNGGICAKTYAISATFKVLKDMGEWLYVETSPATGDPVTGYVKANQLQKVALTSPYRIEVNISRVGPNAQTMYVYHNDVLIDQFKVSTGRKEGTTPTGTFCLLNRKPVFTIESAGAVCYDALRVVGGVCIHRIPHMYGGYNFTQSKLGTPASAGCIRVPINKSSWLYETMPDTTIIRCYRSAN